jgi:hypothetical protein
MSFRFKNQDTFFSRVAQQECLVSKIKYQPNPIWL